MLKFKRYSATSILPQETQIWLVLIKKIKKGFLGNKKVKVKYR